MSRKKGKAGNAGRPYTIGEYNMVFKFAIMGMPFRDLLRPYKRDNVEVFEFLFKRICNNATDYSNKKLYSIPPASREEDEQMNGYAKRYILIQTFETDIKASPKELAKRTGVPVKKIEKLIKDNKSYQERNKSKQELFERKGKIK